ncbi:hypothetical protein EXIGLDRAFT_781650 [Exidia glandulosa HHB12029]|uniref:Uncharacterized protein n=1 Tax=Exidia glandulosa HHB12029 TaxID=1314781 RepID=A0A165B6G9_EXIGL|nr:hypothetical protein EXIGLDRAFT_781650 [Exidia glandulosa HHB12029]
MSSSELDDIDANPRRVARRRDLLNSRSLSRSRSRSPEGSNHEVADPTSSDTDEHEGRVFFKIPPAPKWGPLPERRPRRVRILPGEERSPSPVRAQSVAGDGWPDNGWRFDRHPDYSGWNASAPGHAAAMMMNAAYGAASQVGHNITQVDFRWNTPDKPNVKPLGYNDRGDLAPRAVHILLDPILKEKKLDPKAWPFVHKTIDLCWMLHSRAIMRSPRFLAQLDYFTDREIAQLSWVMREQMFDDGRLLILDPRDEPVYGRTLDSPGQARIYRMFPPRAREPATWDKDDGGASGSSDCSLTRPFERTPMQAMQHLERHHQRRLRNAVDHADRVEAEIRRVEDEVARTEARLRAILRRQDSVEGMLDIFDNGVQALSPLKSESWRATFGLGPATPPTPSLTVGQWPAWGTGPSPSVPAA